MEKVGYGQDLDHVGLQLEKAGNDRFLYQMTFDKDTKA